MLKEVHRIIKFYKLNVAYRPGVIQTIVYVISFHQKLPSCTVEIMTWWRYRYSVGLVIERSWFDSRRYMAAENLEQVIHTDVPLSLCADALRL